MNFEKHGYPTYYPFLLLHVTYMCAMFYVPSKRKIPSANGTCMMSYDWCFPTFQSIMTSLRDRPALFPSFKATSLGPNDFRECTILMKFSAWTWNLKEHEPCLIGQYLLFAGRSLPKYTKSKRQRGFTWLHHKKNNCGTSSWFGSSPARVLTMISEVFYGTNLQVFDDTMLWQLLLLPW